MEHDLALRREKNPDYYSIADGYSDLLKELDQLNLDIIAEGKIKFFPFCQKSRIPPLRRRSEDLNQQLVKWDNQYRGFLYGEKKLVFKEGQDSSIGFLTYLNYLRDMKTELFHLMELIANNYYRFADGYAHQRNYLLTLLGLTLALVGLGLSLYS